MAAVPVAVPVPAGELRRISTASALALVDQLLGDAAEWPSKLISYRLTSPFQADWKEEVGHWLDTAKRLGFSERVLHDIRAGAP